MGRNGEVFLGREHFLVSFKFSGEDALFSSFVG